MLAHYLIHELSHLDASQKRSQDYYYLGPSNKELNNATSSVIGGGSKEDAFHDAIKRKSQKIIVGNASEDDLSDANPDSFISAAGGANLNDALQKFNANSVLRSKMARNNADNLAGFAMSSAIVKG